MKAKVSERNVRKLELEVFGVFIERALAIVRQEEKEQATLADACRLVDTALRAERGETPEPEAQKSGSGSQFIAHLIKSWPAGAEKEERS